MVVSAATTTTAAAPILPKDSLKQYVGRAGEEIRVSRDYFSRSGSELSVFTDDENLRLLDDSNAGWWLVRDGKSGQVGYVPAGIIKTQPELLAISNTFQNVVSSPKAIPGIGLHQRQKPCTSRKRVNFASSPPVEHIFEAPEYEEEELSHMLASGLSLSEGDSDASEESCDEDYLPGSSFLQNALIDEAVRKALGIDSVMRSNSTESIVHVESAVKAAEDQILPSDYISSEERVELPGASQAKPSLFAKIFSRPNATKPAERNDGMVKVFAGNIAPVFSSKACILEESATILELEQVARRMFRIDEEDEDYELTLVHASSHHVLPVQSTFSLGTIIELSKVATIEDGYMQDAKGKPVQRHKNKVSKAHSSLLRARKRNISFKGVKAGFLVDPQLPRHRASDFPSHYQFVLNLKVAPWVRKQFYVWVELESPNKEQQRGSRIALSVRALSTVDEIIQRSRRSMNLGAISGVSYDLVLALEPTYINQFRFHANDGSELLAREMTLNDIRHQWPHIDASGFIFLLRSFVHMTTSK